MGRRGVDAGSGTRHTCGIGPTLGHGTAFRTRWMGQAVAVYRDEDGEFYASDGHCTHERMLLCDGLVMDGIIECPKHNGRFRISDGRAVGPPVTVDLRTYPVRVEGGEVHVDLG